MSAYKRYIKWVSKPSIRAIMLLTVGLAFAVIKSNGDKVLFWGIVAAGIIIAVELLFKFFDEGKKLEGILRASIALAIFVGMALLMQYISQTQSW